MAAQPGPLEGARVLLLAPDPFAVEALASYLEQEGALLTVPFGPEQAEQQEDYDALVAVEPETLEAGNYEPVLSLARLAGIPVVAAQVRDAPPEVGDRLQSVLAGAPPEVAATTGPDAAAEPKIEFDTRRVLRAALTVIAVTSLIWLLFGTGGSLSGPRSGPDVAGTTVAGVPGGQAGQAAATAELAGRVTRSDTRGSIGNATVVASGPMGPMVTITDSEGRWRFTGLRGGTYVVMSTAPHFIARQVEVTVPDGRAVENVHLSLDPETP